MQKQSSLRQRLITGCLVAIVAAGAATSVSAHSPAPLALADRAADNLESIDCPVAADVVISDSWGDVRSGGRRHEGVDIAADRGTPVLAARSGAAEFKQTPAGGKSVWLTTSSGDKFFYAHLDAWNGESRDVTRGDVLGFVGSTGNARGPHLHFETRPSGLAVNPYPATSAACATQTDDAVASVPNVDIPGGQRLR